MSGNNVPYEWRTDIKIDGIKALVGLNGQHKLPEESHSNNAYARLNPDGTLRELRFYDGQHRLRYEMAYHPERNVDPSNKPVLHYSYDDPDAGPHIEMFEILENGYGGDYVFTYDGASRGECTEAFLAAKLWDGMAFDEAEPEIEWIG